MIKKHTREKGRSPSPFASLVHRIEETTALDPTAQRIDDVVEPALSASRSTDLLRGKWLGHAVHPLLTDLPLGAWMSTSLLDLFGGKRSRPAAEGLLGFGTVLVLPTVLTGTAEWAGLRGEERRVGLVHAGLNVVAVGCYGASWIARRRGLYRMGVGLALVGGVTATVSGYLGGHLTVARKVGTTDAD